MTDRLHGKAATDRRNHTPCDQWTDREIFVDLFNWVKRHLSTDEDVHKFFDHYAQGKNDKLSRKVLELKDADGVEWVHEVSVKYTKVKRH